MYNRYIPQSDGSFQKNRVADHRAPPQSRQHASQQPVQPQQEPSCTQTIPRSYQSTSATGFLKRILPKDFDTGDLLVVLLLLLMAGDCEDDKTTTLLTLILYFFL